jgi:hypothetical protein
MLYYPSIESENCSCEELQTEDIIDVQIGRFEWQLKKVTKQK